MLGKSDTMQALVVERLTQDLSGCRIREIAIPHAGPGEVLVRIEAASLAFPDLLMAQGGYQLKPTLPFILGTDIAGTVVCVGSANSRLKVGDAVIATRATGGLAQFGVYAEETLHHQPDGLSFEQAASLGSAYLTAYVALVRRAAIQPGEWLLVHGSAGGVGLAAVDLGKALGARVIASSASLDKLAQVHRLFQPEAVIETSAGFKDKVNALTGGGAEVIFDPVGGDIFDASTRCIAFGGRLLIVGFAGGRIASLPTNIALIKGFSVIGVRAGEYGRRFPTRGAENFSAICEMAGSGIINPHVHTALPLADWRKGFAMLTNRSVVGRVVLCPPRSCAI